MKEPNFKIIALNLLNSITGDTGQDLEYAEHIIRNIHKDAQKEERERINQYFADKADFDTDTDCTIITDRVYHKAFNPDGCGSDGKQGNLCTDCYPINTK